MKTIQKITFYTLASILILSACEKADNSAIQDNKINIVNADTARLINYNTISSEITSTRSAKTGTVDIATEVPTNAADMSTTYESWKVSKNDIFVLPSGKSMSTDIKFAKDVEYYVQGELTVTSAWGSDATIYVMEGGILNYNLPNIQDKNSIINNGTLNLSSTFSVGKDGEIATAKPITVETELAFDQGKFIADAKVTTGRLQFNKKSNYPITFNDCVFADEVQMADGTTSINSSLIVSGDISVIKGYLKLGNDALIQCKTLFFENTSFEIEGQNNNYSVIDAETITLRQNNYMNSFQGCIDIHGELDNQSGKALKWQASILFNDNTHIEGNDCKPSFGAPEDITKTFSLKHIAQLIPAKADLSATAICFDNNLSYISWHKAGKKYKGWIDIIDTRSTDLGEGLYIESSLDAPDVDFNHINASNSEISIAGGNTKGALIGFIEYNSSAPGSDITLNTIKIDGTSGNSLLKINDNYIAVSGGANGTATTIDGKDKGIIDTKAMPYSKYVFENAGETNILYNISGDASKIANLNNDTKSFSVGTITPVDGKNACTSDSEDKIYISMGSAGLKVFQNGTEVGSFNENGTENGDAVNCIAVDDEFVYVAYGTLGLYVLNKKDLSIVSKYKYADASANFVMKKDNGLIYIAYGTDGVHVLKLEEVE